MRGIIPRMFAGAEYSLRVSRRAFLFVVMAAAAGVAAEPEARRVPVKSSNLASIGYDARGRVLEVEFLHGGVYRYFDVPREIFAALMAAESKGRYFGANIRSRFRFEKVTGEPGGRRE